MRKRLLYGLGVALLAICVTLVVWQGSFSFGEYGPSSPEQTFLLWAVSTGARRRFAALPGRCRGSPYAYPRNRAAGVR